MHRCVRVSVNTYVCLQLWDPFCGSGSVILEAISVLLKLPVCHPTHPFPFKSMTSQDHIDMLKAAGVCVEGRKAGVCDVNIERIRRCTLIGTDARASCVAEVSVYGFIYISISAPYSYIESKLSNMLCDYRRDNVFSYSGTTIVA